MYLNDHKSDQNGRHNRLKSLPDFLFTEKEKPLGHVLLKMQSHHYYQQHSGDQNETLTHHNPRSRSRSSSPSPYRRRDFTSSLPDPLLLRVLSLLPPESVGPASLACCRWLRLLGLLRRHLTLLSLPISLTHLLSRFPNLSHLDLVPASFSSSSPSSPYSSSHLLLSRGNFSIHIDPHSLTPFFDSALLDSSVIDSALGIVAKNCSALCKLSVTNASEAGLISIATHCRILQEMELHRCTDSSLRSISAFENLQILKLVGSVEGLYTGPGITDIGLTILAHGCPRLVKLDLSACEGSYDGISAIGRCCPMLEEITISDHRMDPGWIAGLSFCGNLKTLRLMSCKRVDGDPGPMEHLGTCPTIETVQLQRCQLRDKKSLTALFAICESAREVMFRNCWGLDDEMFALTGICRGVELLSLEGCSQLTTEGLESVILSWPTLKSLTVISCNNVKDDAIGPAMATLFSTLKEFKWRPDSKSVLAMSLAGTGMGKKGGRFFKSKRV